MKWHFQEYFRFHLERRSEREAGKSADWNIPAQIQRVEHRAVSEVWHLWIPDIGRHGDRPGNGWVDLTSSLELMQC